MKGNEKNTFIVRVSEDAIKIAKQVKDKHGITLIRFFDEAAELAKKKFKIK